MLTAETPGNVGCSLRLVGESKRGEVPKFIVDAAREIALELERSGLQRKQIAEKIGVDKGRMAPFLNDGKGVGIGPILELANVAGYDPIDLLRSGRLTRKQPSVRTLEGYAAAEAALAPIYLPSILDAGVRALDAVGAARVDVETLRDAANFAQRHAAPVQVRSVEPAGDAKVVADMIDETRAASAAKRQSKKRGAR